MNDMIEKIRKNSRTLDVYIGNTLVGSIHKENNGDVPTYVFQYHQRARANDFVSLIMPVRIEPYLHVGSLHPVFQQNLPEGAQLSYMMQRFGKLVMNEDMVLLGMTGAQSIGRVKIVPHGFDVHWNDLPSVNVDTLCQSPDAGQTVISLFELCVPIQGVAGQMPKALVNDKIALKTDKYIIKTETDQFGGAVIAEALAMQAAMNAGLPVANGMMSVDGSILASRRFDVEGFEDMCSVMGFVPQRKVHGDILLVADRIRRLSSSPAEDIRTVFRWHLFNMAIGNSDGHLKNLGFVYTTSAGVKDIRLAPIYDVLPTSAFDHLKNDLPAMMVNGDRSWNSAAKLYEICNRYGIEAAEIDAMSEQIEAAVDGFLQEVVIARSVYPSFERLGTAIIERVEVLRARRLTQSDVDAPKG